MAKMSPVCFCTLQSWVRPPRCQGKAASEGGECLQCVVLRPEGHDERAVLARRGRGVPCGDRRARPAGAWHARQVCASRGRPAHGRGTQ